MTSITIKVRHKGGKGSGNWNHKGRPGMVGGSALGMARSAAPQVTTRMLKYGEFKDIYGKYPDVLSNKELSDEFSKAHVIYRGVDPSSAKQALSEIGQGIITSRSWIMGERIVGDISKVVSFSLDAVPASTFGTGTGDTVVLEFYKNKLAGVLKPVEYSLGASQSIRWEKEIQGRNLRVLPGAVKRIIIRYRYSGLMSDTERDYKIEEGKKLAAELSMYAPVELNIEQL